MELLQARGALFFDEIVTGTRRLATDVEQGLRELVAWGLVASDGFQGLRQLVRPLASLGTRPPRHRATSAPPAGRPAAGPSFPLHRSRTSMSRPSPSRLLRVLLQRYGVVFRDVVAQESFTVPWREVLRALRRFEARGTVRGGRFVTGFVGEQYALPEALDALRRVRKEPETGERVRVSAVDPANLTGILFPGPRVPAIAGRSVEFVDGMPQVEAVLAASRS